MRLRLTTTLVGWLTTSMLLLHASAVQGGTFCLDSGTDVGLPHVVVVLKGFTKPGKGTCRTFAGYRGDGAYAVPATVTACLNSSGTRLYAGLIIHTFAPDVHPMPPQFSETLLGFDFPYPSLTGAQVTHETFSGEMGVSTPADSKLAKCTVFPMP